MLREREAADKARSKFLAVASDQITVLRAYRAWCRAAETGRSFSVLKTWCRALETGRSLSAYRAWCRAAEMGRRGFVPRR